MHEMFQKLQNLRLIPVVKIEDAAKTAPLCEALLAGGLPCIEITFRTAAAAEAIKIASSQSGMLVGAGTVLTVDQVKAAVDAGATFMISPGLDAEVVAYCQENSIPITPGIATPTDIQQALKMGLEAVKFFPAEAFGGLKTLKAICAPFGNLRVIPTGGISAENVQDYLAFPKVLACGGSWMVKGDLIESGDFDTIQKLTAEAVALAK